jgi:RsmE family RNA methyltransferase
VNRILFEPSELLPDGTVRLTDARAAHIRDVLGADIGRVLQVGMVDGMAGTGQVMDDRPDGLRLAVTLNVEAPSPWIDLILAVPRPKVLKRLWAQLAALGVGRMVLIRASRVEREYFATHWIEEAHYRPLLIEGLTQAGTTHLPAVSVERRFRPYIEDRLDAEFAGSLRLVAHPGPTACLPAADFQKRRILLAVGPEGGWTPFEIDLLAQHGFAGFSMGTRTLRTDTACIALLGVLAYLHGDESESGEGRKRCRA